MYVRNAYYLVQELVAEAWNNGRKPVFPRRTNLFLAHALCHAAAVLQCADAGAFVSFADAPSALH